MLSCSDSCLCRYLEGQDTSHMCFGYLTYHFLYAIAFMRDIVSLVLGKISFGLDVSDVTIFTDSASSACTHIYISVLSWCRERWAYLDDFRGTFRWHICFNFGKRALGLLDLCSILPSSDEYDLYTHDLLHVYIPCF